MVTAFKSVSNIKNIFPFISGWISLLMFDQGSKIRKAAEDDLAIKLTVMALLTVAYVHDAYVALWIYISYFLIRIAFWDFIERISML